MILPTPHTPHPTPYTPHPTPHTPHPTPYTPHPIPRTIFGTRLSLKSEIDNFFKGSSQVYGRYCRYCGQCR
ncbi:MAG: hypothetical protein PX481_17640 [Microcystis sp. M53603_WE2]|uniref:hypothetical protein n=1 Tax=Microcystis sp. M53603_WE2 TaxID=3030678 RepID=UPI0022BE2A35|nr:hypothetical protein [Microcystis sp. M53603_WE2]MCE2663663.1 hypothetical protein [Microcystis sp. 53602_E8]MCZ8364447.1 hypothetical protein [Microcystis sp. LE19-251.1A]MDJ0540464.1 hypothetical protein [Microcystis sp. M53603_WE2]